MCDANRRRRLGLPTSTCSWPFFPTGAVVVDPERVGAEHGLEEWYGRRVVGRGRGSWPEKLLHTVGTVSEGQEGWGEALVVAYRRRGEDVPDSELKETSDPDHFSELCLSCIKIVGAVTDPSVPKELDDFPQPTLGATTRDYGHIRGPWI
jgi:hypothetical protein